MQIFSNGIVNSNDSAQIIQWNSLNKYLLHIYYKFTGEILLKVNYKKKHMSNFLIKLLVLWGKRMHLFLKLQEKYSESYDWRIMEYSWNRGSDI